MIRSTVDSRDQHRPCGGFASAKTCVVFDVCNTLYRENTTFEFIRFYNKKRFRWRFVQAAVSRRISPLYWIFAVIFKAVGFDVPRRVVIASLANEKEAALRSSARQYVQRRLPMQTITMVHARFRHHRARGDRIVLISNSMNIVIEAIAETLDVEWRGSTLGFDKGRCSGKLEADLTGRKLQVVQTLLAEYETPPHLIVYTDNLSDRTLVEAADEAIVIIPPNGDHTAWHGIRADFLFDRQ